MNASSAVPNFPVPFDRTDYFNKLINIQNTIPTPDLRCGHFRQIPKARNNGIFSSCSSYLYLCPRAAWQRAIIAVGEKQKRSSYKLTLTKVCLSHFILTACCCCLPYHTALGCCVEESDKEQFLNEGKIWINNFSPGKLVW